MLPSLLSLSKELDRCAARVVTITPPRDLWFLVAALAYPNNVVAGDGRMQLLAELGASIS